MDFWLNGNFTETHLNGKKESLNFENSKAPLSLPSLIESADWSTVKLRSNLFQNWRGLVLLVVQNITGRKNWRRLVVHVVQNIKIRGGLLCLLCKISQGGKLSAFSNPQRYLRLH